MHLSLRNLWAKCLTRRVSSLEGRLPVQRVNALRLESEKISAMLDEGEDQLTISVFQRRDLVEQLDSPVPEPPYRQL